MRKQFIKHNHLKRILEDIYENEITPDNLNSLVKELKHSNLILAADFSPEGIKLMIHEEDGESYGLLFTDMDEFRKCFSDDDCGSHPHHLAVYKAAVKEDVLDGFVINPESESFIFKKELFMKIDNFTSDIFEDGDAYDSYALKDIKDNLNNSKLEEFIENPDNIGKYNELFKAISGSNLLTLMISYDDLSNFEEDGIISLESRPGTFLYLDKVGGKYATVYTSEDRIKNVKTDHFKYCQIVNFAQLVSFVLSEDFDGIIMNPNAENIMISREVLLDYDCIIDETCNNSKLNAAISCMFTINK